MTAPPSRVARLLPNFVAWLPAAAAVVFLLQLVARQSDVREALNGHADFASAPVLAELMSQAPEDRVVMLGNYAWYEALWLLRATRWLPNHHLVWQLVPFVLWLATALLVWLMLRRVASRPAAATGASLVIVAGLGMRDALWSLTTHGPLAFHAAFAAMSLLWLLRSRGRPRRALYVAVVVVGAGAVTMLGATDQLARAAVLGPLVAASLGLWYRTGDAVAGAGGVLVAVIAGVGARWLDSLGSGAGITWTHQKVTFVPAEQMLSQLGLLPGALGRMAVGNWFAQPVDALTMTTAGAGLLVSVVLVAVLVAAARAVPRQFPPRRADTRDTTAAEPDTDTDTAAAAAADVEAPAPPRATVDDERAALTAFWSSAAVLLLGVWIVTSSAANVYSGRYLAVVIIAIFVLLPMFGDNARSRARPIAALAAAAIVAGSLTVFLDDPRPATDSRLVTERDAAQVRAFAAEYNVRRGYGGFWAAIPITWHTRFALEIYPIWPCGGEPGATRNCQFAHHRITTWYRPAAVGGGPDDRRLLVLDTRTPDQPILDRRFGKPVAVKHIGPMTVYVFGRDLTRNLGDPDLPGQARRALAAADK